MSEIEATTDAPVKQIDESRAAAVKAIEDEIANKKRRYVWITPDDLCFIPEYPTSDFPYRP
jgi:hypothetical protein